MVERVLVAKDLVVRTENSERDSTERDSTESDSIIVRLTGFWHSARLNKL